MAETDVHRDEMVRLIQTLQGWFADRADVYVSGNLLLYYEEGNPRASVAPDVFVVKGVAKQQRPIFKLWEEQAAPDVVIEVTSPSTRREDEGKKRALYARLGVREYYLYDPLAEYLRPPLHGYRLQGDVYQALPPEPSGGLRSEQLGLRLVLVDGRLRFVDDSAGVTLLSPTERAEAEARRADAEAQRADAAARRADAEARRADANAEVLRALEAMLQDRPPPATESP